MSARTRSSRTWFENHISQPWSHKCRCLGHILRVKVVHTRGFLQLFWERKQRSLYTQATFNQFCFSWLTVAGLVCQRNPVPVVVEPLLLPTLVAQRLNSGQVQFTSAVDMTEAFWVVLELKCSASLCPFGQLLDMIWANKQWSEQTNQQIAVLVVWRVGEEKFQYLPTVFMLTQAWASWCMCGLSSWLSSCK